MTILTFLFFTSLVGVLTYFLTRKDDHGTATGYFLAGRTLTGGFIAGSLLLTNLSTEQMVGLNGAAFTDGIAVMAWEVIAGASLVLMALYFLPKYLRSGIATIPEFLEKRFNGVTRSITSFIFIIAYAGILLPIILYTGATGLMGILSGIDHGNPGPDDSALDHGLVHRDRRFDLRHFRRTAHGRGLGHNQRFRTTRRRNPHHDLCAERGQR